MLALPLPQIFCFVFGGTDSLAWPRYWGETCNDPSATGDACPSMNYSENSPPDSFWNWDYMEYNSYTSDHRWYLIMVLQARIYLQICEVLRCPGWLAGVLISIPCVLPNAAFEGKEYAFDICETSEAPHYVLYVFSWIARNFGDGCALYWRWVHWYTAAYVWCYYYLRLLVRVATPRMPKGPVWAAACVGTSMTIGVLMAMFHYPNNVLESGTGVEYAPLEVGVDFIQPMLFALGMTWLPLNLSWWGNTTLGCYAFHFYFKDSVGQALLSIGPAMAWDESGILLFFVVLAIALVFTTLLGPIGHAFLLSPNVLPGKIKRGFQRLRRYQEARQARNAQPSENCVESNAWPAEVRAP